LSELQLTKKAVQNIVAFNPSFCHDVSQITFILGHPTHLGHAGIESCQNRIEKILRKSKNTSFEKHGGTQELYMEPSS